MMNYFLDNKIGILCCAEADTGFMDYILVLKSDYLILILKPKFKQIVKRIKLSSDFEFVGVAPDSKASSAQIQTTINTSIYIG